MLQTKQYFARRWLLIIVAGNPPDLLLKMMDNGNGSSKSRAGVFFLAAGFAFTAMFENICGNAIAGGIDLAGLFPRYINIRRGAIITFVAAWIVQPWQLINKATTFVAVLSSFSVFLAPIIGIMACDYYLLRQRRIRLSHLYRTHDSSYYFAKGFNWRAIPAWICGWAPTIGGLVVTVRGDMAPPRPLVQLYFMAFLIGEKLFDIDTYDTYTDPFRRFLYQCNHILWSQPLLPSSGYGPNG